MRKWQSKMHPAPNSGPKLTVSRVGKAQKTAKNGLKTSKNAHFQPILSLVYEKATQFLIKNTCGNS